ncbi:MAG TPA: hypothetical protein VJ860_08885 [Polyangia bacterium]|jgi:hypothetical protein|nr:hypothetical protein [Polyangia bacterium]
MVSLLPAACKEPPAQRAHEAAPAAQPTVVAKPALQELLAKESELGSGKIEVNAATKTVRITLPGRSPAEVDQTRERLKAIQAKVTKTSGDPELGVRLRFEQGSFVGESAWDSARKRMGTQIALGETEQGELSELALHEDVDYEIWAKTLKKAKVRSGQGKCVGSVTNKSTRPMEIVVGCLAFDEREAMMPALLRPLPRGLAEERAVLGPKDQDLLVSLGTTNPGESKDFDIAHKRKPGDGPYVAKIFADGRPAKYFAEDWAEDRKNWMEVVAKAEPLGLAHHPEDAHTRALPMFLATSAYEAMSDEAKKKAAGAVSLEVRAHLKKFHGSTIIVDMFGLYIFRSTPPDMLFRKGKLIPSK